VVLDRQRLEGIIGRRSIYLFTHDSVIWETQFCANINTSNYCGSGAPYDGCGTDANPGQDNSVGSENGFDVRWRGQDPSR
jgi:hypothetical protein